MNEKIKELTIKSWDYACGMVPSTALGQKNHEDYFAEKLAELIVKECTGILRTEADANWEGREERLLNAMANWIDNHFGVEE
jgi:hypothetical protein